MSKPLQMLFASLAMLAFALPAAAATTTPAQAGLIDPTTGFTYAGAPQAPHATKAHVKKVVKKVSHTAKKSASVTKKAVAKKGTTKKTTTKKTATATSTPLR